MPLQGAQYTGLVHLGQMLPSAGTKIHLGDGPMVQIMESLINVVSNENVSLRQALVEGRATY